MPTGYGFAGHLGLGHEATHATLVARSEFVEILSESITKGINRFERANAFGTFFEPDDAAGLRTVEGDVVFAANAEAMGTWLAAGFGVASTVAIGASTLLTTIFTVRDGDLDNNRPLDSYTIEVNRPDVTSVFIYTGVVVGKLAFSIEPDGPLQITASVVGKGGDVGSATTPVFPSSPADPFTFDQASISWGGAASTVFKSLAIDFDQQIEADPRLTADEDAGAFIKHSGPPMARVTATLAFEDLDDFARFRDQTDNVLEMHISKANSFSVLFELPRVRWTSYGPAISGRERITVEAEGRAFYHVGSGAAIQITLTNNVGSGYPLVGNGL